MWIGWLPSAEDLRSPCLLGCVVELFEWNIIVFNVSSLYIKAFPLLVGISFQIEISLAQPDGCGLLCKAEERIDIRMPSILQNHITEGGNRIGNASFVPMELFVKHPLASHPKGGCFQLLPPPPGDWCLRCGTRLAPCLQGLRLEQRGCWITVLCPFTMQMREQRASQERCWCRCSGLWSLSFLP